MKQRLNLDAPRPGIHRAQLSDGVKVMPADHHPAIMPAGHERAVPAAAVPPVAMPVFQPAARAPASPGIHRALPFDDLPADHQPAIMPADDFQHSAPEASSQLESSLAYFIVLALIVAMLWYARAFR